MAADAGAKATRGVWNPMHKPTAATEHMPEPPERLHVTTAPTQFGPNGPNGLIARLLPAAGPAGDVADMSIEHWYFCGAGSVMRSS